jgi:hypothetical protein
MSATQLPLGLRLNNPGNIDASPTVAWEGEKRPPMERFCEFESSLYGRRALLKLLQNYQYKDNCFSIGDFIKRWAPPIENNVTAYIQDICQYLSAHSTEDYSEGSRLYMNDKDELIALAIAITHHEQGQQPYSDDEWLDSWRAL